MQSALLRRILYLLRSYKWTSTRSPGSSRQWLGNPGAGVPSRGVPGPGSRPWPRLWLPWPGPCPWPRPCPWPAPGSWCYKWLPSGPGILTRVPTVLPTKLDPSPRPPRPSPRSPDMCKRSTCNIIQEQ